MSNLERITLGATWAAIFVFAIASHVAAFFCLLANSQGLGQ